jgi:membrane protease YdiL (CAAX protease family)
VNGAGFDTYAVVVGVILVMVLPLLGLVEHRRLRRWTAAGHPEARLRLYRWIMAEEWVLTAALLGWWLADGRGPGPIRLLPDAERWQWLLVVLGLAAAGLLVAQMNAVVSSAKGLAEVRRKMGDLALLAPRGAREIRVFDMLSVTAGVCEEILYRGILLAIASALMGVWPAVAVTSIVFGLGHAYQGLAGIGKTTLVGVVLAVLAVLSGSLYIPMVLHATIDLTSGRMMSAALDAAERP